MPLKFELVPVRMRVILRLLGGLLTFCLMAGSTSAALACVEAPAQIASASMPAGCPVLPPGATGHHRTSACVQLCAAVTPTLLVAAMPRTTGSRVPIQIPDPLLTWESCLEPPPPRSV